jgi:hypothetical protein
VSSNFSAFIFSHSVKSDIKLTSFLLISANALDSFVLLLTLGHTGVFGGPSVCCIDNVAPYLSV